MNDMRIKRIMDKFLGSAKRIIGKSLSILYAQA